MDNHKFNSNNPYADQSQNKEGPPTFTTEEFEKKVKELEKEMEQDMEESRKFFEKFFGGPSNKDQSSKPAETSLFNLGGSNNKSSSSTWNRCKRVRLTIVRETYV